MPIAEVNGQRLHYTDTGADVRTKTGKDAPVIVLVHGFLMDRRMFDALVDAIGDDFRVVRYDTRALGESPWDGKAFDLYDEVEDCVALLDHLGIEQATIGGMSRGGYIALRLALRHPERVRALVLMGTRASADEEPVRALYRQTRDTWRDHGPIQPLIEGLAGGILGPKDEVEALWKTWLPDWYRLDPHAVAAGMDSMIDRDELSGRLGEIEQPALIIHGDADVGVPVDCGAQLTEELPGAKGFVRIGGAHHSVIMTHLDAFRAPFVEFLQRYGR